MADYGVKIAKSGYDRTDGDNHLVYNSKYPLLKILHTQTGNVSVTSGSYGPTSIYNHALGYKPMFYLYGYYADIGSGSLVSQYRKYSFREYYGLGVWSKYWAYATTSDIMLQINPVYTASYTMNYILVVFYDGIS